MKTVSFYHLCLPLPFSFPVSPRPPTPQSFILSTCLLSNLIHSHSFIHLAYHYSQTKINNFSLSCLFLMLWIHIFKIFLPKTNWIISPSQSETFSVSSTVMGQRMNLCSLAVKIIQPNLSQSTFPGISPTTLF